VATTDTAFAVTGGSAKGGADRLRLFAQPVVVALIVVGVVTVALAADLDDVERETLNGPSLLRNTWDHLVLTFVVAVLVAGVAIPLGVALTRRPAAPAAPVFLGIANIGQSAPSIGVMVLFFMWSGWEGLWAAAIPIAFYSLLPVLRNTIVGLRQVDPALIDAGRGIGMSSGAVLRRIELPLAVPLILAGLRTSLVVAVGTATLAHFVNGGGLGLLIDTGYKLNRPSVLITGAVLAVGLALLVDWIGAVAERYLGPKGLR
jgi:osmoprotectant transport system permease protein